MPFGIGRGEKSSGPLLIISYLHWGREDILSCDDLPALARNDPQTVAFHRKSPAFWARGSNSWAVSSCRRGGHGAGVNRACR